MKTEVDVISCCELVSRVLILPVGAIIRQEIQRPREVQEIPNTTEKRIALITEGSLDFKGASQFLNETFEASDYVRALLGYPAQQQFIDSLYEARNSHCLCELCLDLIPHSFFVMALSISWLANAAFWL